MNVYRRLFGLVAGVVAVVVTIGVGDVWAEGQGHEDTTCQSGSIASGVYSNLKIAGACTVQSGSVTVKHNLTVLPGGSLVAVTGGFGFGAVPILSSDITVGGDLEVQTNGILVLGCEPIYFPCANDPDQKIGTFATKDTVVGNLTAENALAIVVHRTVIGQNVLVSGGGGGVNSCKSFLPAVGAPPYGDFEDDVIGGSLRIIGWQSCWLGWARDTVLDNVAFDGNVTGDPDGNEMLNDTVVGNLNCSGNNPSPQIGDSGGGPTTVLGNANGQCAFKPGLVVH